MLRFFSETHISAKFPGLETFISENDDEYRTSRCLVTVPYISTRVTVRYTVPSYNDLGYQFRAEGRVYCLSVPPTVQTDVLIEMLRNCFFLSVMRGGHCCSTMQCFSCYLEIYFFLSKLEIINSTLGKALGEYFNTLFWSQVYLVWFNISSFLLCCTCTCAPLFMIKRFPHIEREESGTRFLTSGLFSFLGQCL